MNIDGNAILRLWFCAHAPGQAEFIICVSYDRDQRYYIPECRLKVRRRQRQRLITATSKANRQGNLIAFASSAIGIGRTNPL